MPETPKLARRDQPPTISGSERGVVLIWALLTAFLVAGIVLATSDEMRAVDQQANFEFSAKGQVEEVAQAGLTDAVAWFRQQSTQPVVSFDPKGLPPSKRPSWSHAPQAKLPVKLGGKANPGKGNGKAATKGLPPGLARELEAAPYYSLTTVDSETPELGLVRTYQLTPEVWARYTVNRGVLSEPYNDANGNGKRERNESYEDLNGDGRWSAGMHSRDVSRARGASGLGSVWYITSLGEIFRRPRPDLDLGEGPNTRLARSLWGTELRRLTISVPAAAAICIQDGARCTIGPKVTIRGETAIAYDRAGGDPTIGGEATPKKGKKGKQAKKAVKGNLGAMPDFDTSYQTVFGVPWTRLMSMADVSTSDPQNGLPARLPRGSLIVIMGDVSFDADKPLRGDGIVVVRGNCTIDRGSNSFFTGVLHVDGDLEINGPAVLRGTVIVTGTCDARGVGSEAVEIEHDTSVVSEMLSSVGQYRPAKAPFRVRDKVDGPSAPATPADPDESSEPEKSGKSGKSGSPGKAGKSGKPGSPGKTGKSGKAGSPGKARKSGKSGKSD